MSEPSRPVTVNRSGLKFGSSLDRFSCLIQVASDFCPEVQTIKEAITTGKWDTCSVSVKAVKDELSVCDGVILRGSRILIPYKS